MTHTPSQMPDELKEFAENCLEAHEYGSLEYRLAHAYLESTRAASVPSDKAVKCEHCNNKGGFQERVNGQILSYACPLCNGKSRKYGAPDQTKTINALVNVVHGFMSDTQGMNGMSQRMAQAKKALALAKKAVGE